MKPAVLEDVWNPTIEQSMSTRDACLSLHVCMMHMHREHLQRRTRTPRAMYMALYTMYREDVGGTRVPLRESIEGAVPPFSRLSSHPRTWGAGGALTGTAR